MNKKYMYVVIFYVLYVNNKQTKGTIQNIHIILLQTVNHTCTCTGRKYKREIILYNYEISTTAIPYIIFYFYGPLSGRVREVSLY